MTHHQKADGVHAQFTRILNMLGRHVRFGAVGRHTHNARPSLIRIFQVMNRANARQQQRGDLGVLDHVRRRFNPLQVAVRTKAIVKTGTLQTVAVRHLNGIHPRVVQRFGNLAHVFQRILMTNGVHAVAQGHVRDIEFFTVHAASPA